MDLIKQLNIQMENAPLNGLLDNKLILIRHGFSEFNKNYDILFKV